MGVMEATEEMQDTMETVDMEGMEDMGEAQEVDMETVGMEDPVAVGVMAERTVMAAMEVGVAMVVQVGTITEMVGTVVVVVMAAMVGTTTMVAMEDLAVMAVMVDILEMVVMAAVVEVVDTGVRRTHMKVSWKYNCWVLRPIGCNVSSALKLCQK